MDTDEILYTVSEAVRKSREFQDETRETQKQQLLGRETSSGVLYYEEGVVQTKDAVSGACALESKLLRDMFAGPSEALCAFLTITLHLKRAHGLPGTAPFPLPHLIPTQPNLSSFARAASTHPGFDAASEALQCGDVPHAQPPTLPS